MPRQIGLDGEYYWEPTRTVYTNSGGKRRHKCEYCHKEFEIPCRLEDWGYWVDGTCGGKRLCCTYDHMRKLEQMVKAKTPPRIRLTPEKENMLRYYWERAYAPSTAAGMVGVSPTTADYWYDKFDAEALRGGEETNADRRKKPGK